MEALVTTFYATGFGRGTLVWHGEVLVSHMLPHTGGPKRGRPQPPPAAAGMTAAQKRLGDSLKAYFSGNSSGIDVSQVKLHLKDLTGFEKSVAVTLAASAYGELTSYAALATSAGYPGAARAVGNFMAKNPWPVIIPCHRVIRSDGRLGGFSCGTEWKERLLTLEGSWPQANCVAKAAASW